MLAWLWIIPTLPFAGSLILAVVGKRLPQRYVAVIGTGSIALASFISFLVGGSFLHSPPERFRYVLHLWTWMEVGSFRPEITLYLDALSMIMMVVITFVAFLIHLYSTEFMQGDSGYSRFFAYMNLFVASMLVLILADNLLLLYLGWEGVGLCSYLLIGFWYADPINGRAARKAFIVTRAGDTAMMIGMFLLYYSLGTLQIQDLLHRAHDLWPGGSGIALAAGLLLLGGAVGKSAQLPLQTWLPDAMAGPTPTSALIHTATMVTAGVYLIARTHTLYMLAPAAQSAVAVVGAATLILAGCSALTQRDIKRVLAYSTVSQIGYMFLALGVGAWQAAIFHFMTHAFFKALLFLAAGMVIEALHHEHDIFKMGGLYKQLPLTFWTFVAGGGSLAGLPLITAGFYSKGRILWESRASIDGSSILWAAGVVGVFLTSLYTFRLIFRVFLGPVRTPAARRPGLGMGIPAVVLAFLSIVGGGVYTPHWLGNVHIWADVMGSALPPAVERASEGMSEMGSEAVVTAAFVAGLFIAYLLFFRKREWDEALGKLTLARMIRQFWFEGWAFDRFYDRVFVKPIEKISSLNKGDFVDSFYTAVERTTTFCHRALSLTQTGSVRWYAAAITAGTVLFVALVLFL